MMTAPDGAGPAAAGQETPGWDIRADDVADEDVDVLSLTGSARQPGVPGCGSLSPRPGGAVSSRPCSCRGTRPRACGGDVLLRIAPGTSQAEEHWPGPAARVQVQAVVAGSLIPVAGWDHLSLALWPEAVRAAAAFAMGALRELQEHGADVGARDQVDVEAAAQPAPAGFPRLPAWVKAGAMG
jgi:hypothetical protein